MSEFYPQLPLTSFPESVDTFPQFLDLTQTDYPMLIGYQEAIQIGNTALAQQYLEQLPQASQKIVSALKLNELREAILALEKFYGDNVEDYIDSKEAQWTAYVDRFKYLGVFNPTTAYTTNNIVQYSASGVVGLYINTYEGTTPVGTVPTNDVYWRLFTVRGLRGEGGDNGNFLFDWDSGVTYNEGNIVVYDNMWWNCLQTNQNQPPVQGSAYWEFVLQITQPAYPVQPQEPSTQVTGEFWFKVI